MSSNPLANVHIMGSDKRPSFRSTITAGRWSKAEALLRKVAWNNNISITIEIDKGWIEHQIRFELRGDQSDIQRALADLRKYRND